MDSEKIAIILDSNILIKNLNDKEKLSIFSLELYDDTTDMIERNDLVDKVTIFIPEIVFLELVKHKRIRLKSRLNDLEKISFELDEIKEININIDKQFNENHHIDTIKKSKFEEINLIKMPKNKEKLFQKILDMSINKIPPFKEGKSDKGFKDAIVMLSIIEFANLNDYTKFILFSDDKGFDKNNKKVSDFFKKETSKEIIIKNDRDIHGYLAETYELFKDFKQYLNSKFYTQLDDELKTLETIQDYKTQQVYKIDKITINSNKTSFEELTENEYKLTVGFDTICKDENNRLIKIEDLNKIYYFKQTENQWNITKDEEFNYTIS